MQPAPRPELVSDEDAIFDHDDPASSPPTHDFLEKGSRWPSACTPSCRPSGWSRRRTRSRGRTSCSLWRDDGPVPVSPLPPPVLGSGLTELQGETGLEALNLVVRGQLALHDGTCERQGLGQSGPTVRGPTILALFRCLPR